MIRKVIFILVCLVALSSCHWNGGKSSDSAELNIKVARYDRLLFEYVTMNNLSALQKMNTDFPQATKLLIEDVLAIIIDACVACSNLINHKRGGKMEVYFC